MGYNEASNEYDDVSEHFDCIKHQYENKVEFMLKEKDAVRSKRGTTNFI